MTLRYRIIARGPLTRPSDVRGTVQAEFASANDTASRLLTTAASGYVHRAFGTYQQAWTRRPTQFGRTRRLIVHDEANNPRIHAAVHETGRRPNTRAGGVQQLMRWIVLRGAALAKPGERDVSVLGMAIAISRKHAKEGWPNLGSFKGGYYPGRPPKPVERAMETQSAPVVNAFEQATRRIARRLA